ncbi:MAG: MBL fold metallo-hydrolase [Planctomycetota bacterium]|jgi:glyoxylase-like metal-dependent hydrolase (beta-lactamase superfamily II)
MQKLAISVLAVAVGLTVAQAAQAPQDVEIQTVKVADNVYMLVGQGGNIGLSVGEDGAFLIDDQFAPLTQKITNAVKKISSRPIRFVVNTHWHGDHTGGNENLGQAGSLIVAHENVRQRMSTEQFIRGLDRRVPASPQGALPVITFTESVTFYWNADEVYVLHVEPAHTDGDSIIYFRKANVLHMGDTYFNGMYPFIDVAAGGSLDGMITAVDRALELANEQTQFIAGHGPMSGIQELRSFQEMLKAVGGRVRSLVQQGKSLEEVIASKPTRDFDAQWGDGFLKPDQWVGIVYDGMSEK